MTNLVSKNVLPYGLSLTIASTSNASYNNLLCAVGLDRPGSVANAPLGSNLVGTLPAIALSYAMSASKNHFKIIFDESVPHQYQYLNQ